MAITNKQLIILDFIKRFMSENGYSPTIREIMNGCNLKSPSTVFGHIKSLEVNGVLKYDKGKSRTIELLVENEYVKKSEEIVNVGLIDNEYEDVAKNTVPIPEFMLNGHDPKKVYVFKKDDAYYIVDSTLSFKTKPSLTITNGVFDIEKKPKGEVFGNIIGEYKMY